MGSECEEEPRKKLYMAFNIGRKQLQQQEVSGSVSTKGVSLPFTKEEFKHKKLKNKNMIFITNNLKCLQLT
jgi:hypothetical protein